MEELNEVSLKNINSDLSKQIKDLKVQVNEAAYEVTESHRKIRQLEARLEELKEQNLKIYRINLVSKRKSIEEKASLQSEIYEESLENAVKNFMTEIEWK